MRSLTGLVLISLVVHVDPLRRSDQGRPRLRSPVAPVAVRPLEGQRRVRVDDVVVDALRIFRIAGRIEVGEVALADFRKALEGRYPEAHELDDERILRIYFRGLRLVHPNASSGGVGTELRMARDGTFLWSCVLPAEDVLFELSPRSSNPGPGFDRTSRLIVTPAGDRTLDLVLDYPATGVNGVKPSPRTALAADR